MALRARGPDLGRTYTPEEFEALPQFDELYELVDGKLVKKPMPGDAHGRIAKRIDRKLAAFDPAEKSGLMWRDTSFDVGTGWLPIPDLGFIVAERVPREREKSVKGVPDLVVEIHSPTDLRSQKEREATRRKIADWLGVGVQIVWSVNPRAKTVEVFHRGQLSPVQTLGEDDELSGEDVIPGFKLKVSDIFG
jgi:Uma2 family endonuclease